jgi:hypothetical protein
MNEQKIPPTPGSVKDSRALFIGPDSYRVTPLDPDPAVARLAFRVEKAQGGDCYDVRLPNWPENLPDGYAECDCKGFLAHGHCKHIDALRQAGLLPRSGKDSRQPAIESWRRVWREGIAPQFTDKDLEILATALEKDDPALIQGATTSPPLVLCCEDRAPEGGCLLAYVAWKSQRLQTIRAVEEWFAFICQQCDQALGEPAGTRWLLNWYDETPRPQMREALLAEVRLVIWERLKNRLPSRARRAS